MNVRVDGTIELISKFYMKNGMIYETSMGNCLTGNEFNDKFILQMINGNLCQIIQDDKPVIIENENITIKFTGKNIKRIEISDNQKIRLSISNNLKEENTHTC